MFASFRLIVLRSLCSFSFICDFCQASGNPTVFYGPCSFEAPIRASPFSFWVVWIFRIEKLNSSDHSFALCILFFLLFLWRPSQLPRAFLYVFCSQNVRHFSPVTTAARWMRPLDSARWEVALYPLSDFIFLSCDFGDIFCFLSANNFKDHLDSVR